MIQKIVFFSMLLSTTHCFGDYLELRTNAGIKSEPKSSASIIYQGAKGDLFSLLNEAEQTNGYYKVDLKDGRTGWVYRTIVRLHKGSLPPALQEDEPTTAEFYGLGHIPTNYYSKIGNSSGEELHQKLHRIIRNHKTYSYGDVWDALSTIDKDPANADNVVLLYSKRSQKAINRDRGTSYDYEKHGYSLTDSWNREHVWPKSHGFPNKSDTAYTDLHHLRPADRTINSARNTRSFDMALDIYFDNRGTVETPCYTSSASWAWEPPDEVKGDVARMLFYMAIRYDGPDYDLELVEGVVTKGNKEPILGSLNTLLNWHVNDPVDNWERKRNHIIFSEYQGNRNPFIDHPEYAVLIWGD